MLFDTHQSNRRWWVDWWRCYSFLICFSQLVEINEWNASISLLPRREEEEEEEKFFLSNDEQDVTSHTLNYALELVIVLFVDLRYAMNVCMCVWVWNWLINWLIDYWKGINDIATYLWSSNWICDRASGREREREGGKERPRERERDWIFLKKQSHKVSEEWINDSIWRVFILASICISIVELCLLLFRSLFKMKKV